MKQFEAVRLFVVVAQAGTFSAAARKLAVTPSSIARRIAALEEEIGVRLLNRTTRSMELTEAGRNYYVRAAQIVRDFDELNSEIVEAEATPRGVLRISASVALGANRIAAALPDFLAQHPDVTVDLLLSDHLVDLVEERVDLALRIAPELPDSSLIARKMFPYRRIVCGSPAYLAARGAPATPADLVGHEGLSFLSEGRRGLADAGGQVWRFSRGEEEYAIPVNGRLHSNSRAALIEAAANGFGLILAPVWQIERQVGAGELQPVLQDYEVALNEAQSFVHAVYPSNRFLAPKVRAFIDFMIARFGKELADRPAIGSAVGTP